MKYEELLMHVVLEVVHIGGKCVLAALKSVFIIEIRSKYFLFTFINTFQMFLNNFRKKKKNYRIFVSV